MTCGRISTRWIFVGLASVAVFAAVVAGVCWWRPAQITPLAANREKSFPLPGYSKSPYLNTGAEARYIGTAACAACHPGNHQSYLLTAHSRSLSDVDPAREPPDASFEHKPSGRSYRVYRQDGKMRHEEVLRSTDGKDIARVDLPVRYLIGSGNFARSYIVEVEGFLYESPITYFASKQRWSMSPGYDVAGHWGFERPIKANCMFCHSGQVQALDGTAHRLAFPEKSIGCESCHGPGSLHQDLHRTQQLASGADDWTIVNPAKLPRALQEDVCGSCHLQGLASVPLRGREYSDFRPGMPLSDYRIQYRFDSGSEEMTLGGHVEQLRQSECYKKSNMTCLTCHDPHQRALPQDTVAYYRQKCLSCHGDGVGTVCSVPKADRLQKQAADDCTICHMPRGDTEVAHVAFTHHRIGRHTSHKPGELTGTPKLVPLEDVNRLSAIDQQRNLGVAYLLASRNPECAPLREAYREKSRVLLDALHSDGLRDATTTEMLMDLYGPVQMDRAAALARELLEMQDASASARGLALFGLANKDMSEQNYGSAAERYAALGKLFRGPDYSRLLGICYLQLNQTENALPTLQDAVSMRPYMPEIHLALAEAYRRSGKNELAREHEQTANLLLQRAR